MFSLAYLCTSSLITLEEANIVILVKEQDVLVKELVRIQTYTLHLFVVPRIVVLVLDCKVTGKGSSL